MAIRYYCNTCGQQVRSLGELTDLSAKKSSEDFPAKVPVIGLFQDHICSRCIDAIKRFLVTLKNRATPDPRPTVTQQTTGETIN